MYIKHITTIQRYYHLVMITHLWAACTHESPYNCVLLSRWALCKASCAQGNGRSGTRGCSRSQHGTDCTA